MSFKLSKIVVINEKKIIARIRRNSKRAYHNVIRTKKKLHKATIATATKLSRGLETFESIVHCPKCIANKRQAKA